MTRMIAGLTAERVRGDIDVLSRAGLDLDHFVQEAVGAVGRAVPWVGACVGTHDPASLMLTSARKYGALTPNRDDDLLFGQLEYGFGEFTSFRSLVHHDIRAVSMLQLPKDVVDGSPRTHQLIRPVYGFTDEARLLMRDDTGMWGCLALFRDDGAPFAEDDLTFLESLSAAFARGVRSGILTRLGAAETEAPSARGPAVVVVNAAGEIAQISRGATQVLEELATLGDAGAPTASSPGWPARRGRWRPTPRCRCPPHGCGCRRVIGRCCMRRRWTAPTGLPATSWSRSRRPDHPRSWPWWSRRSVSHPGNAK